MEEVMKKIAYILLIILLAGCSTPVEETEPYTINIDTVRQGGITYKKLVIHNHEEYDDVLDQSRKLLEEVSVDLKEFGEVSIIFYKGKKIYCVVDGTEINYIK